MGVAGGSLHYGQGFIHALAVGCSLCILYKENDNPGRKSEYDALNFESKNMSSLIPTLRDASTARFYDRTERKPFG